MDDLISRRTAQRLFAKALTFQEHVGRYKWITAEMKQWIADFIEDLPSAQPPIKPVDYQDCAMAMLRMWMDNVVTDSEYYRIMDKLNEFWGKTDNE